MAITIGQTLGSYQVISLLGREGWEKCIAPATHNFNETLL